MPQTFIEFLVEKKLVDAQTAAELAGKARLMREPIGMIAVGHGLLAAPEIDEILDRQKVSEERFGEIAVAMGYLTRSQVDTLINVQDLRASVVLAEVLALAQVVSFDEVVRSLGAYLACDAEVASILSCR